MAAISSFRPTNMAIVTSHTNDLFILKKVLCRVDGEMKHENFQSNELIRAGLSKVASCRQKSPPT